jgi:toxin ParE1/3/4
VKRIRWTEQAVGDLEAIRQYVERDSARYGRLVVERLYESALRLQVFPISGRVVPELRRDDVREIITGEYRVVYLLRADVVTVLTVFRSSRVFPTLLEGLE